MFGYVFIGRQRQMILIERVIQLDEIAQGLAYLHEENVVHGDLNDVRTCSR
jgi:tRNA A-37 threonylcarbamoyl transferase component Bud32